LSSYILADMRSKLLLLSFVATFCVRSAFSESDFGRLTAAVERSTLAQPSTGPFHLKATLAPSYERDKDSGRSGTVEIWWLSPGHYRRELRIPTFHQVEIVDGPQVWQHNDGDYLPEWLRAIAGKLIEPVPAPQLARARGAEIRHLLGTTYFQWADLSSDGTVQKGMGVSVGLNDSTGLLRLSGNGPERYEKFHGLMVAHVITDGSLEVRATVDVLEDMPPVAKDFFDATQSGGDANRIQTIELDELSLRRNLEDVAPPVWPALRDGPLEGILTTRIIVDRAGHVRDCSTPISGNPGIKDAARNYICGLTFRPVLVGGEPVQVVSRFTVPFKTTRPVGAESFESARFYFERGRKAGFPATESSPSILRAEFQTKGASGEIETGRYEDTFVDEQHWRREAWFGASHAVRSRNGEKRYRLEEGPQAGLTRLVLRITEPIPAIDTFVESDWRMNSVDENGVHAVRVLSGYEGPDGKLDPQHSRGYWFNDQGQLIKTYSNGFETRRSDFQEFGGGERCAFCRALQQRRTCPEAEGEGVVNKSGRWAKDLRSQGPRMDSAVHR
jgi:hypothetical protein